jgi:hypothetical protein
MLALWYVYQYDLLVNNGKPSVVVGCKGTAAGGSCFFDELLQHVQSTTPANKFSGTSGVGHDLWPDVKTTAQQLQKQGYRATFIASKAFGPSYKEPDGLGFLLDWLADGFLKLKNSANGKSATPFIDPVKDAFQGMHEMRLAANANDMIRLAGTFTGSVPEVNVGGGQSKIDPSVKWDVIDQDATERKMPGFKQKYKNFIYLLEGAQVRKDKSLKAIYGTVAMHHKAVNAVQNSESKLHAGC